MTQTEAWVLGARYVRQPGWRPGLVAELQQVEFPPGEDPLITVFVPGEVTSDPLRFNELAHRTTRWQPCSKDGRPWALA